MIQSILFDNRLFSVATAKKWLRNHGYRSTKVDLRHSYIRFRQKEPRSGDRYVTKDLKNGILLIISVSK